MRVLVFGAGGYIGIPLCEELARLGHSVLAADRWFFERRPSGPNIIIATFDIREMHGLIGALDAVIDLSGLSNDASADIDPELTRSINLEGGKRLATLAKEAGVRRYVYSSSCSVYGHGTKRDLTEIDEAKPLTLYAECKVKVEDHIRSLEGDGFEAVILRNATVFGVAPRMRFDLVANIMALTAWRDHQIIVRGGEQWRPFVWVQDVVHALCGGALSHLKPDTYNVGCENLTINQVARAVSEVAPWAKIVRVAEAIDARDYHVSFRKYEQFMGTSWSVSDGAREVIAALRNEQISGDDPTTHTLNWYKSLLDWDRRLADIRLGGRIL